MNITHAQPVAGGLGTVDLDIYIVAGDAPLGEDATRARHGLNYLLHSFTQHLQGVEIGPENLYADLSANAW